MAWFSLAIKLALQRWFGHIYKKQSREQRVAMADAQHMHADLQMARGEEAYQGKLLESRDRQIYKDEVVLIAILTASHFGPWPGESGQTIHGGRLTNKVKSLF